MKLLVPMLMGPPKIQALARAIYSRAPILILDDILSALDQSTAKLIFSRLLATDGLLKRQGRTVVLATHAGTNILLL